MPQDRQRDDLVALCKRNAAHTHRRAALEHAHVGDGKTDALAAGGGEQHVVPFSADLHVDDALALVELHGDDAGAAHVDEVGQLVAPDRAARGGEHHVELAPGLFVLGQRHHRRDQLTLLERQDVDQCLAAGLRRRLRQPPHLLLVDTAVRGKEQHGCMGGGDKQPGNEVLLARLHPCPPLPAAPLRAIGREWHALDVAEMRDRHHHVLAVDQVFFLDLPFLVDDHACGAGLANFSRTLLSSSLMMVWIRARERRISRYWRSPPRACRARP